MGRSFIEKGGSNPLEPAQLDCAVLHGPHTDNFHELYNALDQDGGAREVADTAELAETVVRLLSNETERAQMTAQALKQVAEAQEVLSRTNEAIITLMRNSGNDHAVA